MLATLRRLFTGEAGLVSSLVMIVIVANVGLNIWQRNTIADLKDWRAGVLEEIAQAVDQRNDKGQLLPVKAADARAHIASLGRFRTDVIAARLKAQADDSRAVLDAERENSTLTRKDADDYLSQIAAIRAEADRLRANLAAARAAGGVRSTDRAAGTDSGGRGDAPVPGLSAARSGADAATEAAGLSPSGDACTPMSIDERQDATEQAHQLDRLISSIEKLKAADDRRRAESDR